MNLLIIPAAGRGTRLDYVGPKLLYPLDGRPLIDYLLSRYSPHIDHFVIVINPKDESLVKTYLEHTQYNYSLEYQSKPTGMLDAILEPIDRFKNHEISQIWVTWCDQVGITAKTASKLSDLLVNTVKPCLIMPTTEKPHPYIHFQRNHSGDIIRVLQRREGDSMPEVGENDCGLFGLSHDTYFSLLPRYAEINQSGSQTKERNFLPFIAWLKDQGTVVTYPADQAVESIGINTVGDAEKILKLWKRM